MIPGPRAFAALLRCCRPRRFLLATWLAGVAVVAGSPCALGQTLSEAFGAYTAVPTGSWPEAVAIGDLNGDGRNDVVMGTSSYGTTVNNRSILIFFQNTKAALAAPVRYDAGGDANSIVIADLDGDGKNDIAVGRESAGIRVFYQGTGGDFSAYTDYPTANANWICSADFNHDGRADIAGIGWSSQVVDVFTQTANGTLALAGEYAADYEGWNDLETADLNNDGWSDIIVMSGQGLGPNLSVLLQTAGGFTAAAPYDLGGNELAGGIGVGDLSGDGRAGIALVYGGNRPASKLTLFNQQTDGTLLRGATFDSYDIPGATVVADVDMDGRPDILTLHDGWNRLGVYFQTSPGGFDTERLFVIPYASRYNPHGLAVGDINGDRTPDVVIADYNNGLVVLTNHFTAPPPPIRQLTDPDLSNGTLRFNLNGPEGYSYVIQVSSNLVDWQPLLTNTIPAGGSLPVADPVTAGVPRRFYRATPGGAAAPANDSFAGRAILASAGETVTGSNAGATKEGGEPNHGGDPGGKSVWWSWTAPASGITTVSTDGSSFDTTLGVYVGGNVGSLTAVAGDNNGGEGPRSRVVFNAAAGVEYQIAVDGAGGAGGAIRLTVKPGLLNDNFADRLELTGGADAVLGSNVGAGREFGEPEHWPGTGGASVWWSWQATQTGNVTISTAGSSFDTLLAAYTGSSVSGLTVVTRNDDYGTGGTSQISFQAIGGTRYQIAVDGYGGESGAIVLTLLQQ